jgi:hypothetical protein
MLSVLGHQSHAGSAACVEVGVAVAITNVVIGMPCTRWTLGAGRMLTAGRKLFERAEATQPTPPAPPLLPLLLPRPMLPWEGHLVACHCC